MQKDYVSIGIKVEPKQLERIDTLARLTRRPRTAIIRIALDLLTLENLRDYSLETPVEVPVDAQA